MTEITERAVAARVPSLTDEKLKSLSRRDPLTVRPGTTLAECLRLIREVHERLLQGVRGHDRRPAART